MSFILDALKKSENERQRQVGPSFADTPVRRARADRPWWAFAVAGLLLVNLGVLLAVLLRDRTPASPQVAPAPVAAAPAQSAPQPPMDEPPPPPQPAMAAPTQTSPMVQSLAEVAGVDSNAADEETVDPALEGAAAVPAGPPLVRPIAPPRVTPLPNQATFAARDRAENAATQDEMLPTHGGLVANGTALPEMRLDIHVYSQKPQERFVFVNMRKYVEGQTLSEGALLERITSDGAILNQNGTRFLLPRQ